MNDIKKFNFLGAEFNSLGCMAKAKSDNVLFELLDCLAVLEIGDKYARMVGKVIESSDEATEKLLFKLINLCSE